VLLPVAATHARLDDRPSSLRPEQGEYVMTGSRQDWVLAACSAKPGAAEDYPFGDEVAVFKVVGRMFALVPLGQTPASVSLKCDPDLAVGLRGRYAGITPGYHLNKRHWNTVTLDGSVPDEEVLELLDHSYDLVVARLTKAQRDQLIT
jgi:predicted DNA-binding protein (MmcQ/YjbR family)